MNNKKNEEFKRGIFIFSIVLVFLIILVPPYISDDINNLYIHTIIPFMGSTFLPILLFLTGGITIIRGVYLFIKGGEPFYAKLIAHGSLCFFIGFFLISIYQ